MDFYQHAWIDCLIQGHSESYIGHGREQEQALQDALRGMLPSKLSRDMFFAQLFMEDDSLTASGEDREEGDTVTSERYEALDRDDSTGLEEDEYNGEQTEGRSELTESLTETVVSPTADEDTFVGSVEDLGNAYAVFDLIEESLNAIDLDIPMETPRRLQVLITFYLCQLRHYQEQLPDPSLTASVHDFVNRFGHWSRVLWPGNFPVLQVSAKPNSSSMALFGKPASSWMDLVHHAMEELDNDPNADDQGWSDLPACSPACPNPDEQLDKAVFEIDLVLGGRHDAGSKEIQRAAEVLDNQGSEKLIHACQVLRWIRPDVSNPWKWGKAMGRLRWMASRKFLQGHPLRSLVDPSWYPKPDWAHSLGQDPRSVEEKQKMRRALQERPPEDSKAEDLVPWLSLICSLLDMKDLPRYLRPYRLQLIELQDDVNELFKGRDLKSVRSKLSRVIDRFAKNPEEAIESPPEVEKSEVIPERVPGPLDFAKQLVKGRNALVISNRQDLFLQKAYEEKFGLEVNWIDLNQNRNLQAQAEAIERKQYDLVFTVTGFMNHASEGIIKKACLKSCVHYISVGKGRPQKAALHILRVLKPQLYHEFVSA